MASWRTTPTNPGLRVFAPHWESMPDADYTCICGATGYARGENDVRGLIAEFGQQHAAHMNIGMRGAR